MLLSAVSVLVVAQSSSEIPEGLMNNSVFNCTAFSLLFYIVPATNDDIIILWNELLCSLFISVCMLCYQPSCHNSIHLAMVFQFAVAKILHECWR